MQRRGRENGLRKKGAAAKRGGGDAAKDFVQQRNGIALHTCSSGCQRHAGRLALNSGWGS
jgi:hypothetical protein